MKQTRRTGRRAAFTLVELLVVISIIGVLAGLTVAVLPGIMKQRNVKRLQGDHAALVTAIENYKAGQGFYPAGNSSSTTQAPLYYELKGVIVEDPDTGIRFRQGNTTLTSDKLMTIFGVSGIANASLGPPAEPPPKDYFPTMPIQMADDIPNTDPPAKRMVSGVRGSDGEPLVFHYDVTSQNRHNSESYDLWIEYVSKGKTNRVANW